MFSFDYRERAKLLILTLFGVVRIFAQISRK